MRRKALILAAIGFLPGVVMGNLIAWFSGGTLVNTKLVPLMGSDAGAVILQSLLSGLLGAIAMGGVVVYKIERWPLALSSVVHFLLIVITYVSIALTAGWIQSAKELFIMLGIQLTVYFIIWLIMYLRYKAQVRELNELLAQSREPGREETPSGPGK